MVNQLGMFEWALYGWLCVGSGWLCGVSDKLGTNPRVVSDKGAAAGDPKGAVILPDNKNLGVKARVGRG